MNDAYSYAQSKSSDIDLHKYFITLLNMAKASSSNGASIDKQLLAYYSNQFKKIGFKYGIAGLEYYLNFEIGNKFPSVSQVSEWGGKPIPKPFNERDQANALAGDIMKAISIFGFRSGNDYQFLEAIGPLGRDVLLRCGVNCLQNLAYEDKDRLFSRIERQANIVIKINAENTDIKNLDPARDQIQPAIESKL